jgi:hypothetical protein
MDRAIALSQLPAVYASALRLRDQGVDDDGVAHSLGIPTESIPALFRIAEAKLLEIWQLFSKDGDSEGPGRDAGPLKGGGQVS